MLWIQVQILNANSYINNSNVRQITINQHGINFNTFYLRIERVLPNLLLSISDYNKCKFGGYITHKKYYKTN